MLIIPFPDCMYAAMFKAKPSLLVQRVRWTLAYEGQLITERYTKHIIHMLIIQFPFCMYATIYYKNGRRIIFSAHLWAKMNPMVWLGHQNYM